MRSACSIVFAGRRSLSESCRLCGVRDVLHNPPMQRTGAAVSSLEFESGSGAVPAADRHYVMPVGSLTFWIMDATADDWESLDQIQPVVDRWWQPTPRLVVAEEIVRLVQSGLFEEMPHQDRGDEELSAAVVVADPMRFWFGMTAQGRKQWEQEASTIELPDEA
jgi:hypothetical protein